MTVPKHIAIIMDGNGRWARKRLMPKKIGHKQGLVVAENIAKACQKLGVQYLTLYAFSLENWFREKGEIDDLMNLFRTYLATRSDELIKNDIRLIFIGNKILLPIDIQEMIKRVEYDSQNNKFFLILAISYGARDEIRNAAKRMAEYAIDNNINNIDEKLFDNLINPLQIPDPDLLIRTSGEKRLSNFLLWQIAYSELYFIEKLWPDFNEHDLNDAIYEFTLRDRRYGK